MASLSLRPLMLFELLFLLLVQLSQRSCLPPTHPLFFKSIIWDLFSFCRRCYSQNAKSEIEEVTHVICLPMACLDTGLSAMEMAHTSSFETHKEKERKKTQQQRSFSVYKLTHLIVQ